MDSKIKTLLDKIGFDKDSYNYFDNAKLVKIVGNKTKTKFVFYVENDKVLPIAIYNQLKDKIIKTFAEYEEVSINMNINLDNYEQVKAYFLEYIKIYAKEYPTLEMIAYSMEIIDNVLVLEVANKAEKMKLDSVIKKIKLNLNDIGFKNINIKVSINKNLNEDLDFEIKPIAIKKEESSVIKGNLIKQKGVNISDIMYEEQNIVLDALVFALEIKEVTRFYIFSLKLTDQKDSLYANIFIKKEDKEEYEKLKKSLKEGSYYRFKGNLKDDTYKKELVLSVTDINVLNDCKNEVKDEANEKRVELHTHTFMSQMDGVVDAKDLIKKAYEWGHKAIAITDHNGVQSFPDVFHVVNDLNKGKEDKDKFKAIYGSELTLVNDEINICKRENDSLLLDNTYVVFDFETTGFNAGGEDSIIEIGAVKLYNGEIIDTFSKLIDPKKKLNQKITEITGITDDMVKGKEDEKTVVKEFINWFGDLPMVAHNAKFDVSFLEMAYFKYNLGTFNNMVIDTLELSRSLDSTYARHSLTHITKRYDVVFNEDEHHRADYDAKATALVYHKMMNKLVGINKTKVSDLNKLVAHEDIYKFGRAYHVNILVKNKEGLKNLFKIVSLANTKYYYKGARILRSELEKLREGLLIGSGCYNSEVFEEAKSKSDQDLINIINFYDYVEVQPKSCYTHLIQLSDIANENELEDLLKKIIVHTKEAGKIMVATGDVHHLNKEDKIYREIIVNQKVPGGGLHPLAKKDITEIPSQHFRTTLEMLDDFKFLGETEAYEIVVKNTNKIADMVEIYDVIPQTHGIPFSPKIENSAETVRQIVYDKAHLIYGDALPNIIEDRINQELTGIINGGFDVIYLIAQKLVKKSNDDGYIVGSRGSVGSSFVATMMGITEVNPLPAHYICPNCKHSIFELNGISLGTNYFCGYDLPDMDCPKCNTRMKKEGQDMPFATFLGFNADKVPDIDLNFSGEYQWKAHEYTKELFGIDYVYRAGTIGTVADKTAFGFVKGYCEDKGITKRNAEIERLALGCTGVKRTTGQHPGGIVVIPNYKEVFDFTPFQYPADDTSSLWRTTHFDYHAIDECVLKLDILGHDDPTMIKMLTDLSNIKIEDIPLDDEETMKIFCSPEPLKVSKEKIMCETGTLGVPEFGTKFVIGMLNDTKPKTFAELIKISGLSHGTDVWLGNAQELIKNKVVDFKDVIGCRDDIMVYLMYHGLEPLKAFKIMEFVRKGKASKDPDTWKEHEQVMRDAKIEEWFIDSCKKIKYMFPKAHAAAYVISAFRIAYYKVHYPILYYAAYLSVRCNDFDIDTMIKGYDAIKKRIIDINNKGFEATKKENDLVEVLSVVLESCARGIKYANIDISKSDSTKFIILQDNTLLPPFRTLDGLGDTVATKIVQEREKGNFLSIEDLQKRCKISNTLIEKMKVMHILDNMEESSQLKLF